MNKIYNVVYSEEHGTWVVCSELDKRSRKKSSTKLNATVASVLVATTNIATMSAHASSCGNGTTVANGGSCDMGTYTVSTNDQLAGQALANNGETITLNSANMGNIKASGFASTLNGPAKRLYKDATILADMENTHRFTVQEQNATKNVYDSAVGSNQTVNYYNNIGYQTIADTTITAPTGNDAYINMRLGTANGANSTLNVNLGDATQTPGKAVNKPEAYLPAKQSRLVQAENGGSVNWVSRNRVTYENMELGSQKLSKTWQVFNPKTFNFMGETITLNNIEDLKKFNTEKLVPAIGKTGFANKGETQQNAYNRWYALAASTAAKTFTEDRTLTAHPDSTVAVPERWVMAATDANSIATLKSGGEIDQRTPGSISKTGSLVSHATGGGMLAENGGKIVVEDGSILSGHFNNVTVRGTGSTGENYGVISGGYLSNGTYDTTGTAPGSPDGSDGYAEGHAVIVRNNGIFNNHGIINIAGYTYPGYTYTNQAIVVNTNGIATNKMGGIINVGVNDNEQSRVEGVQVGANGTFVGEQGSTIFIGRTAQYSKNAAETLIGNAADQVGIYIAADGANVSQNGIITIGKETQGTTGVSVNNGSASTVVTLGQNSVINILGTAQGANGGQPKQNIGVQVQNSDAAQVTNNGTINVSGTNAVGENVVAESGHTAKIVNTDSSRIVVEEANTNLVTRNYGIYADGQDTGSTEATIDGSLELKGNNVIGAHARGNSTFAVDSSMSTTFSGGANQVGFHIYGENAVANVAALTNATDVSTQDSNLFRADDGGTVTATQANTIISGNNAVAFSSNGASATKASNITVNGTYHLTGTGASVMRVSGGATGDLKGTAAVADNVSDAIIAKVDGLAYDLNNQVLTNSIANEQTKLVSALNATSNSARSTGFSVHNKGNLEFTGSLNLNGTGSKGVTTISDSKAVLTGSTVSVQGDALYANSGTNNITINGGIITGTDNIFNSVSGINTLTASNDATLNGVMSLDAGISNVNLNNATWNNSGNSTLSNLNNMGIVSFDAPVAYSVGNFKKITVNGDYAGNNGNLVVNTYWNNDADKDSDQLIIKGTAIGNTTVTTRNGIIGNIAQSNAQQFSSDVITVEQAQPNAAGQQAGQPDSNAVFTGTANTTNAGQAQLVLKETAGGKNVYAWTLYASTIPPTPTPNPTPAPRMRYIYALPIAAYVQMPRVNQEIGFNTLNTLHERRGENQVLAWDECGTCGKQAKGQSWARIFGHHLKMNGKERLGYETNYAGVQAGHDFFVHHTEKGGHNLAGIYAAYTRGKTDFYDKYRAENGVVSHDKFTGKGDTDMVSLGLTNTYYALNGTYLDFVGQVSWLRNKYKSRDKVSVKQNGWGLGLSVEAGRPFALGERTPSESGWFIEPQAQLTYQYVGLNDFNDGTRKVDQGKQNTLRGRLGARLAYNAPNTYLRTNTFYLVGNLWHDFTNPNRVEIGTDKVKEKYNRTWGEIGLGSQLPVGKNSYLYGDVRYERNLGGAKREGYRGTVGFKYTWK